MIVPGLNYWYKSAQDLFGKVCRDKEKLSDSLSSQDQERIADAVFNFAVTAYHVKDWLKQEGTKTFTPRDVEEYVNNNKVLSICADLCNGSKHRNFDDEKHNPRSTATGTGNSPLKVSMTSITCSSSIPVTGFIPVIETAEGNQYDILTWADQVVLAWEDFFTTHGI
ncbi:hypothetical protein Nos7524_3599 [Nostoc sp. PCC 7524]|uniref:hypothetical protein n=1 Tax=Nostoc sp. (strain ATCC 29411 / PCC 7524) TaxID=28072 RepID=UPI00029EFD1A|nr:hypothetical protein [Nostoc sp. PCC 7524]AFY49389.1 hypothetical protein Nos7524_3599 [Nostoc sp. PCC 7524]